MPPEIWEVSFFFPGTFPGMNEIVSAAKGCSGTGRMYSKMKGEQTNAIALQARAEFMNCMTFERYTMRFTWHLKDKRRDPDNVVAAKKFILDGLVVAGVLAGDSQKHFMGIDGESWLFRPARPGVDVVVSSAP